MFQKLIHNLLQAVAVRLSRLHVEEEEIPLLPDPDAAHLLVVGADEVVDAVILGLGKAGPGPHEAVAKPGGAGGEEHLLGRFPVDPFNEPKRGLLAVIRTKLLFQPKRMTIRIGAARRGGSATATAAARWRKHRRCGDPGISRWRT